MAEKNSSDVLLLHDFSPFIKVYKNGRFKRIFDEGPFIVPSTDQETMVQSKDVQISSNLSARVYLPKNATLSSKKLPLLLYMHGGGFVIGSPFHSTYHKHLNLLVSESNIVAISLDYNLVPEHPLPVAYEDAWIAFKWIISNNEDEWLKNYVDFDRVYIGGDSAGGNIAHNLAMRVGLEMEGVKVLGLYLNSPYFWGEDPNGDPNYVHLWDFKANDIWLFACPGSRGEDDPRANPCMDSKLSRIGCRKVLYFIGGKDVMKDRGVLYKEALEKRDWNGEIEVVEFEGECHCFSLISPYCENSKIMFKKLASFLNHC